MALGSALHTTLPGGTWLATVAVATGSAMLLPGRPWVRGEARSAFDDAPREEG